MPSSLLVLPDGLLALIVDEALGEFASRLYKQRQAAARALALVNHRCGRVAQARLVEAVHFEWTAECPDWRSGTLPSPNRVRCLCLRNAQDHARSLGLALAPWSLVDFNALCDLRLVAVTGVILELLGQLPGPLCR